MNSETKGKLCTQISSRLNVSRQWCIDHGIEIIIIHNDNLKENKLMNKKVPPMRKQNKFIVR